MKLKWDNYVTNTTVLERANGISIEAMIMKHHLRWSGRVVCMDDTRLPKKIFSERSTSDHPRGCPLLRLKDQLKKSLKDTGTDHNTFETLGSNRNECQNKIKEEAGLFKENRKARPVGKKQLRAGRAHQPQPAPTILCDKM